MSVFAQKKLYVQRFRTDSLNLQMLRHSNSDTILVIQNDTVYWMLASEIPFVFDSSHCWTKLYTDTLASCGGKIVLKDTVIIGTVRFPLTDGTAGQSLTTNGSGVVGWGSPDVIYGTAIDSTLIKTGLKFPIGYVTKGFTIDSMFVIVTSTGGTINFKPQIRYGTSIGDTGTAIINSPSAVPAVTGVLKYYAFNNATIPQGVMLWLVFTDVTAIPRNTLIQLKGH